MQRSPRQQWVGDARRLMGVALVLALVFRLVAGPALMSPPAPGLVPICAGDKIVWLGLGGGPDKPAPRPADPCPVFGFAAAAPVAVAPDPAPCKVTFVAYPDAGVRPARPADEPAAYRSRAPPSRRATT